ncbi:MAG: Dual-specificity kinase, spindle pole body (SPB) duplication and spindle checkpoint function [Chrysothrix sp. TS-e1954]|nr:MAG: Dual-specificity kinase, spindle pole body (SPB) duplication and spindle checkpoint function [Chrysothrix sp. TS-e1954]
MTTASPTPFPLSSFADHDHSRYHPPRPSAPRTQPTRPALHRHSPLSSLGHSHGFSADAPMLQSISIGDSSDDDIPKPMNFSALTKAILEKGPSSKTRLSPQDRQHNSTGAARQEQVRQPDPHPRAAISSQPAFRVRRSPRSQQRSSSPPHRVVRLSDSGSFSSTKQSGPREKDQDAHPGPSSRSLAEEIVTPAPVIRRKISTKSRTNSMASAETRRSQAGSATRSSAQSDGVHLPSHSQGQDPSSAQQIPSSASNGLDPERLKFLNDAMPGSMRVKRVPIGSGTFLRGAPMRRGIRRTHSDDANGAADDDLKAVGHGEALAEATPQDSERAGDPEHVAPGTPAPLAISHDAATSAARSEEILVRGGASASGVSGLVNDPITLQSRRQADTSQLESVPKSSALSGQILPVYRVPGPSTASSLPDQENEPPPTFKRNKSKGSGILVAHDDVATAFERAPRMLAPTSTPAASPPKRQALAPLNQNTPLRPAPPPPKMSVLETATASAGASTVKSKKKRSHVLVNGKMFTLRGRLGKGGSSDVYRVMAENDKMFALKKVNLEDCNEDTVRGYKGEIELLKKLENNDRVVRLFDFEVNEQKQSLSVLMEMGESDLNRIFGTRVQPESSHLDLAFTRHYWREMVSCVEAVHAHDIVHSDLKPANFLLVQGRLKLIDFGIANAIDTDNTVNVHRETNVGTPNYMSPESLQDSNAGSGRARGEPKVMKLGKPSDVWSLGCILYQMTYSRPPFAHIANQWNRVMAIINPDINISYPAQGVGGVTVPASLRRLLQRCLNRDPSKRPTVAQLLDDREAFLNPDLQHDGAVPMTEELLAQVLQKVVDRCRDPRRGFPSDDDLRGYPSAFLGQIRAGLERI